MEQTLVTFRGHRFNHLFLAAGRTVYHKDDIKMFLQQWSDPNELLKSVAFDIGELSYLSSIPALGIIDKLIIGPLWRIIESKPSILEVNPELQRLRNSLEALAKDASPLMNGEEIFQDYKPTKDCVYESLFTNEEDPVLDTYTQMALELAVGGVLLILERQARDQSEGGKYHDPDENERIRAASVPTTNTCSERDFAQLDVLMRMKPSASTECYESVIMWTNNKTTEWLLNKTEAERYDIIEKARQDIPKIMKEIRQKKNKLHEEKVKKLKAKQELKAKKEEKIYTESVKLTAGVTKLGGMWMSHDEVDSFAVSHAIITQLQFRKNVIKSQGPRELFQQQFKGKVYSLQELEENLKTVISLNRDNEICNEDDKKLIYKSTAEAVENINQAKVSLAEKILTGRNKILIQQQKSLLPDLLENPEKLVGKRVKHKFRLDTGDVEWFLGRLLKSNQS